MASVDNSTFVSKLAAEYDAAKETLFQQSPTILIIGPTGAGKSSLINALFGSAVAQTGDGAPCTQSFDYYPAIPGRTVNLYDSKGLEPMDNEFLSNLKSFIKARTALSVKDITKGIHCVWYVVNASNARWSSGDSDIVQDILRGVPTVIVLNKCDIASVEQREAIIKEMNEYGIANVKGFAYVSARPHTFRPPACSEHGNDDISIRRLTNVWRCNECGVGGALDFSPQGLDELVHITLSQLPELLKTSFLAAQGARLESLKLAAYLTVGGAAITAYAIGWSPIPLSDAPLLAALQLSMAAALSAIFGLLKSSVIPVVASQAAVIGVGLGLTSLLKLIPGVGTIAAGLIDSTVAGLFTLVLGLIYTSLFSLAYKAAINSTAEERTTVFLRLVESLDVKNILRKLTEMFKGVSFRNKDELNKAVPAMGQRVDNILAQQLQHLL